MAEKETAGAAKETAQESTDEAQDTAGQATDQAQGAAENGGGLAAELKETAKEAALSVLKPAVKTAATSAATYAVNKGPDMIKDRVGSLGNGEGLKDLADNALSNAGPLGKVASTFGMGGKLVGNLTGGDDDDEEGGPAEAEAVGSGRRMPVQQAMDVAVPIDVAYNQWTQFEEYPNFMHRVDSASQDDETHVTFTEKVWGFGRDFEAEILDQRPNERIMWRSVNGLKHAGVVTFHELAPRLTHIEVTVDFKPESLFQKFARGTRYSKRAIRADMHRLKAYIEMKEEEDGSWLGRIEDGEVVQSHEDAEQEREAEAEGEEEQPQAEEEEQPEAEEEEQPEAEEEEQPEAEEEEQPEAESSDEGEEQEEEQQQQQQQRPRRRRARSQSSGDGGQRQRRSSPGSRRKRPQRRQPARA